MANPVSRERVLAELTEWHEARTVAALLDAEPEQLPEVQALLDALVEEGVVGLLVAPGAPQYVDIRGALEEWRRLTRAQRRVLVAASEGRSMNGNSLASAVVLRRLGLLDSFIRSPGGSGLHKVTFWLSASGERLLVAAEAQGEASLVALAQSASG